MTTAKQPSERELKKARAREYWDAERAAGRDPSGQQIADLVGAGRSTVNVWRQEWLGVTPDPNRVKQRNASNEPAAPLAEIPGPRPITEDTFVAIREIADIAVPPVEYPTVEQWRARRRARVIPFPEPDDNIGSFPIWRLSRIEAWFKATGRPFDLKLWRRKKKNGGYRRGGKA